MPKGQAKSGQRALQPDSIASRLVALVLRETTARQRSLTFLEATRLYRDQYGARPDASRALHQVLARGYLLGAYVLPRVGYVCHPAHPYLLVPRNEPSVVAVRLVNAVWRRYRRPATTREITRVLRRRDARVRARYVSSMLECLAQPKRRSRAEVRTQPLRMEETRSSIGEVQRLWYPADVPVSCPVPASTAEGMRVIVRASSEALDGWPVSATEMSVWCDAHPASAAAQMYGPHLGRARRFPGARRDARHAGEPNRLHAIRTVFTCVGGLQERFCLGPPAAIACFRSTVVDLATCLRPATEFRGIADLREGSTRLRLPSYAMLASAREYLVLTAVSTRLRDTWPADAAALTGARIATEVEGARTVVLKLRSWARAAAARTDAPAKRGKRRARRLGVLLEELDGMECIARHPSLMARMTQPSPIPRIIGEGAMVAVDELRPYLDAVGRALGHTVDDHNRHVLARARRVPFLGPQPTWHRTHRDGAIDRVDAMLDIFSAFPMPQTAGMLGDARRILGEVLRDTRMCYQLLEELPAMMHALRGSVVVALALLGELVDVSVGLPDAREVHAVTAYVLAGRLVIADDVTYDTWLRTLMAAVPNRSGKNVVDHARQRLEQGSSISVID